MIDISTMNKDKYISIQELADLKGVSTRAIRMSRDKYVTREIIVRGGKSFEILLLSIELDLQEKYFEQKAQITSDSTALIPIVGAFLGGAVGAFILLMESPMKAVIFVIFLVILQQVEGNIIYPRVVGSSIGLPGIWVLTAVTVGGGVFGIFGMLIAVPLAACIYRLLRENVNKNSEAKPLRAEAEKEC